MTPPRGRLSAESVHGQPVELDSMSGRERGTPLVHYLLMYDVVEDYVTRRAPLRAAHIGLAREAAARGELVLGGALNPPEGVVLLFRGESPAAAEAFAAADPYVQNGLVKSWKVREWTTVVGPDAQVKLPDVIS
jgi:uncharacterized protein YciI